jgi:hypothetical protein
MAKEKMKELRIKTAERDNKKELKEELSFIEIMDRMSKTRKDRYYEPEDTDE